MKSVTFIATALVALALGGAAAAQDVVRAQDPGSITNYLFNQGIASKSETDNYGDPLIRFRIGDYPYSIFFYDCTDNANCASLRFYLGFETNGSVGMDKVNTLNLENRFVNLAIDDEDDVIITMDVLTGEQGMSHADFDNLVTLFIDLGEDAESRFGD